MENRWIEIYALIKIVFLDFTDDVILKKTSYHYVRNSSGDTNPLSLMQ